ncbi:MAG: class I SAM-dependent methyltransferase [Gemmatimonadota bacterium]
MYHALGVDTDYQNWRSVPIYEVVALLRHQSAFVGRDVLDLGVGTGRTTRFLAPLARRYEAIDFSPVMVEALERNQPGISVRLGDIRDLSHFSEDSFDFVLGSNNVISAVGHRDRLKVLAEVHRVLRPGGKFAFTSHNQKYRHAGAAPRLELHRNPVTALRDLLTYVRRWINHARVGRYRETNEDYALFDDLGHDFGLLHYYVDRPHAERQLVDAGFLVRDVFSPQGRRLAPDTFGEAAPFLMYVAEKGNTAADRNRGAISAPGEASDRRGHRLEGSRRTRATSKVAE